MATEEQFAIDIHYNKLLGEANPDPPAILIKQIICSMHIYTLATSPGLSLDLKQIMNRWGPGVEGGGGGNKVYTLG